MDRRDCTLGVSGSLAGASHPGLEQVPASLSASFPRTRRGCLALISDGSRERLNVVQIWKWGGRGAQRRPDGRPAGSGRPGSKHSCNTGCGGGGMAPAAAFWRPWGTNAGSSPRPRRRDAFTGAPMSSDPPPPIAPGAPRLRRPPAHASWHALMQHVHRHTADHQLAPRRRLPAHGRWHVFM